MKATSKVNNVGNLSGAGAGIPGGGVGQRQSGRRQRHRAATDRSVAPGAQGAQRCTGAAGAQVRRVRGGGGVAAVAAAQPGIDRPYFYNELIGTQGGHTALILAARGGYTDAAKTLVAAGADVNQISAGDKTSPMLIAAINGHFDLAKWLLDQGADPNAAAEQRRDAALRRAERDVGAARAVSAAARLQPAADHLSRFHEGAAREGRRSEPAPHQEGVVLGIQLRPRRRRRDRRDAVLARGVCRRRGRDDAALSSTAPTRTFRRCVRPAAGRSAMPARRAT